MSQWHIWAQIPQGGFQYLGQAQGDCFEEACQRLAETNASFRENFHPAKMTFNGNPLIPLDRRIDGLCVQFGSTQDKTVEPAS